METTCVKENFKLLLKQIGINLAKARIEKGLSQRKLGKVADKNPSMIAKVETYAPLDISFRNVYEVAQLIPVSLGEIISKSEKELSLYSISREPQKLTERLEMLVERFRDLSFEEQLWLADMVEGLLARTSAPSKRTDRADTHPQDLSQCASL